ALVLVREVSEKSYRLSHRMNLHKIVANCLMSPQAIRIIFCQNLAIAYVLNYERTRRSPHQKTYLIKS
ncbi:MAG: hypothetical protein ACK48D_20185, partial [Pseudanabaena sp.]